MNYQETLDYLFSRLPMYQRQGAAALKFNLDNIKELMKALGNPHESVKTIHIAGTNGKGSTAHMLSSILQEAGYKTGLYTSPHLKSFTERIRLNGHQVEEQFVIDFVATNQVLIESVKPSFFEITFAMAMAYFVAQKVEIAIIEVGLGGRLDSTNIITPELSLITNISMDHQHLLGDTLEKIATEKAGIIKEGVPVVITQRQSLLVQLFTDKAASLRAPIFFADQEFRVEQASEERFNIIYNNEIIHEGVIFDLRGGYQKYNVTGVLMACKLLAEQGWSLSEAAIVGGLEKVIENTGLKGRWQQLRDKPLIITDTGHNESGVMEIINGLKKINYLKLHIVWGMVNDKEVGDILQLLPADATYYFVKPDIPRGLPATELAQQAARYNLQGEVYENVVSAIKAARKSASEKDLLFIGGSTFVVAEIPEL